MTLPKGLHPKSILQIGLPFLVYMNMGLQNISDRKLSVWQRHMFDLNKDLNVEDICQRVFLT